MIGALLYGKASTILSLAVIRMSIRRGIDRFIQIAVWLEVGTLLFAGVSVRAQQIMSFEAYQSLDHSEPYIYQITADSGALLYFGSRHSFDPTDSQITKIQEAWKTFRPDVAFTEGGMLSVDSLSQTEAIERYGEFGMTRLLAKRDSVPVRSLDPDRGSEITYLRNRGWSDEQLMLFYTLRQVAQSQSQQVTVNLSEAVPKYLASLVQRFSMQGPTTVSEFEQSVERLLPDVQNWREISMAYFYPGPQDQTFFTNEIATESNQFRDLYHVELLKNAVLSGIRVFAIAGSAHAVMQEPALRSILQP